MTIILVAHSMTSGTLTEQLYASFHSLCEEIRRSPGLTALVTTGPDGNEIHEFYAKMFEALQKNSKDTFPLRLMSGESIELPRSLSLPEIESFVRAGRMHWPHLRIADARSFIARLCGVPIGDVLFIAQDGTQTVATGCQERFQSGNNIMVVIAPNNVDRRIHDHGEAHPMPEYLNDLAQVTRGRIAIDGIPTIEPLSGPINQPRSVVNPYSIFCATMSDFLSIMFMPLAALARLAIATQFIDGQHDNWRSLIAILYSSLIIDLPLHIAIAAGKTCAKGVGTRDTEYSSILNRAYTDIIGYDCMWFACIHVMLFILRLTPEDAYHPDQSRITPLKLATAEEFASYVLACMTLLFQRWKETRSTSQDRAPIPTDGRQQPLLDV